jgi:hypothetical protein
VLWFLFLLRAGQIELQKSVLQKVYKKVYRGWVQVMNEVQRCCNKVYKRFCNEVYKRVCSEVYKKVYKKAYKVFVMKCTKDVCSEKPKVYKKCVQVYKRVCSEAYKRFVVRRTKKAYKVYKRCL